MNGNKFLLDTLTTAHSDISTKTPRLILVFTK